MDYWGAMPLPGRTMDVELGDELADLVVRADAEDVDAERRLEYIHRTDPRVRPGGQVQQFSPRGEPPRLVRLDEAAGYSLGSHSTSGIPAAR